MVRRRSGPGRRMARRPAGPQQVRPPAGAAIDLPGSRPARRGDGVEELLAAVSKRLVPIPPPPGGRALYGRKKLETCQLLVKFGRVARPSARACITHPLRPYTGCHNRIAAVSTARQPAAAHPTLLIRCIFLRVPSISSISSPVSSWHPASLRKVWISVWTWFGQNR